MSLWSKAWWKETRDRAIQTAAASALGALGADAIVGATGINPVNINWQFVCATPILGAIISVLTSISTGTIQRRRNGNGKPKNGKPT